MDTTSNLQSNPAQPLSSPSSQSLPPPTTTTHPSSSSRSAAPPSLHLSPIATHPTSWDPASIRVTLNLCLDGCIVPDITGGARVDQAHLVVLDDFFEEQHRQELLDFITAPDWPPDAPPPAPKWLRSTRDRPDAAPTWGLTGDWLTALATSILTSKLEVQSRLAALYPEYDIVHMPSDAIQVLGEGVGEEEGEEGEEGMEVGEEAGRGKRAGEAGAGAVEGGGRPGGRGDEVGREEGEGGGGAGEGLAGGGGKRGREVDDDEEEEEEEAAVGGGAVVDCNQFVANAAMVGDSYSWHVDADPATLPYPSPWTLQYGQYVNREPSRPLFVSLLLYLNAEWERGWDGETLFLDSPSDCGVVVRPKAYRAVLLDQDILHRLSAPSPSAASRPRYSLVWKLVFLPRRLRGGVRPSLSRPQWGRPTAFGSAAVVERVVARMAGKGGAGRGRGEAREAAGTDRAGTECGGGAGEAGGGREDAEEAPQADLMVCGGEAVEVGRGGGGGGGGGQRVGEATMAVRATDNDAAGGRDDGKESDSGGEVLSGKGGDRAVGGSEKRKKKKRGVSGRDRRAKKRAKREAAAAAGAGAAAAAAAGASAGVGNYPTPGAMDVVISHHTTAAGDAAGDAQVPAAVPRVTDGSQVVAGGNGREAVMAEGGCGTGSGDSGSDTRIGRSRDGPPEVAAREICGVDEGLGPAAAVGSSGHQGAQPGSKQGLSKGARRRLRKRAAVAAAAAGAGKGIGGSAGNGGVGGAAAAVEVALATRDRVLAVGGAVSSPLQPGEGVSGPEAAGGAPGGNAAQKHEKGGEGKEATEVEATEVEAAAAEAAEVAVGGSNGEGRGFARGDVGGHGVVDGGDGGGAADEGGGVQQAVVDGTKRRRSRKGRSAKRKKRPAPVAAACARVAEEGGDTTAQGAGADEVAAREEQDEMQYDKGQEMGTGMTALV